MFRIWKNHIRMTGYLLVVGLIILPPLSGITAQAFATKPVDQIRGTRVNIWTAEHPTGWYAIAGLSAICTQNDMGACPAGARFFETGYVIGTITIERPNVLQQYAAWVDNSGGSRTGSALAI